jgi:hypothetical protein
MTMQNTDFKKMLVHARSLLKAGNVKEVSNLFQRKGFVRMRVTARKAKVILAIGVLAGSLIVATLIGAPAPACANGKCAPACLEHEYCECTRTCADPDGDGRCNWWDERCRCLPNPEPTPPQWRGKKKKAKPGSLSIYM